MYISSYFEMKWTELCNKRLLDPLKHKVLVDENFI